MKVLAAIHADLERAPLGMRSRLAETLHGETVLRRTVERVRQARGLASIHVLVPEPQFDRVRSLLDGLDVRIEPHPPGPPPWQMYITSARKWALDGWRGGIGDAAVFDECIHPAALEALGRRESADAVAVVPGAAALIDPEMLGRLVEHFEKVQADVRMVFAQSAPGLTVPIYSLSLLADLARAAQPPGRIMAYRPNDPQRDMTAQPCNMACDASILHAAGRCLADTATGMDRLAALLDSGAGDALAASRWLLQHRVDPLPLPSDVEVELTTEDPLPQSILRPRAQAVPRRGPLTRELFTRLVSELATRDDTRLTLGGFGDPLLHPEWPELLRIATAAGVFGLAVRTTAVTLDEAASAVLMDAGVDVLHVLLDAATPETYRRLHGADQFDRVMANLERFLAAQHRRTGTVAAPPLLVCEISKTRATMDEMESFYDHWLSRAGAAVIIGPSHYAGQWPDLAVMNMAPPNRFPCGRLFQRAMILADGTVPVCDQDFRGAHAAGSLKDSTLAAIWHGLMFNQVRQSHRDGAYNGMPLCPRCDEWHR